MSPKAPVRMTIDEWLAEGRRRFGDDPFKWKMVCPACGHVQSPEDFRPYEDAGATPDSARMECIGRYDGHIRVTMGTKPGPCNYAGYGLFRLSPVEVVKPDGTTVMSFGFAEPMPSTDSEAVMEMCRCGHRRWRHCSGKCGDETCRGRCNSCEACASFTAASLEPMPSTDSGGENA